MKKKKTNKNKKLSLFEAGVILDIGNKIIKDFVKKYPETEKILFKEYTGKLFPLMQQYYDQFLKKDNEETKGEYKKELTDEWMHVECFARWLDNKVILKKVK